VSKEDDDHPWRVLAKARPIGRALLWRWCSRRIPRIYLRFSSLYPHVGVLYSWHRSPRRRTLGSLSSSSESAFAASTESWRRSCRRPSAGRSGACTDLSRSRRFALRSFRETSSSCSRSDSEYLDDDEPMLLSLVSMLDVLLVMLIVSSPEGTSLFIIPDRDDGDFWRLRRLWARTSAGLDAVGDEDIVFRGWV